MNHNDNDGLNHNDGLDIFLSWLPIIFLIVVTALVPRNPRCAPWIAPLRAKTSLSLTAVMVYLIRLIHFESNPTHLNAAILDGVLTALTPLAVLAGAVLFHSMLDRTGALHSLVDGIERCTRGHPVSQLLLIGWNFSFLIEGISGFGTPAAICAPLLVSLGFSPLVAAAACLAFNSVPVVFGAVGTPIWFGIGQGLPAAVVGSAQADANEELLMKVGWRAAVLSSLATLFVVPVVLSFSVSSVRRDLLHSWRFVLVAIVAACLPFMLGALGSYEFPSIVGGLVGTALVAALSYTTQSCLAAVIDNPCISTSSSSPPPTNTTADNSNITSTTDTVMTEIIPPASSSSPTTGRRKKKRKKPLRRRQRPTTATTTTEYASSPDVDNNTVDNTTPSTRVPVFWKASLPMVGVVLLLLLTRLESLGLRPLLNAEQPSGSLDLGSLGEFRISPALVFSLYGIFGTETNWKLSLLYVPFVIPFVVVVVGTLLAFRRCTRVDYAAVFGTAWARIQSVFTAIVAALVLVKLLTVDLEQSSVTILGLALSRALGSAWQPFAFLFGVLGSFFAGSATVSNLMFAPIQATIAEQNGLDPATLLALQACGSAFGNMISLQNIVAVMAVLGEKRMESELFLLTVRPLLVATVVCAVLSYIF